MRVASFAKRKVESIVAQIWHRKIEMYEIGSAVSERGKFYSIQKFMESSLQLRFLTQIQHSIQVPQQKTQIHVIMRKNTLLDKYFKNSMDVSFV